MRKKVVILVAAVAISIPFVCFGATPGAGTNVNVPSPKLNPQPEPPLPVKSAAERIPYNQLDPQPEPPRPGLPPGSPAKYTAKCETNLVLDLQFDRSWLARHVSAPGATTENISSVKLILQNSVVSDPNVLCFYASPNKDVPNIVYKFPCKNAKPEGAKGTYSCTR